MHYHVLRVSYNTSSGKELEPVDVGTAYDSLQTRTIAAADGQQFRLPSANRFLLHDWKTRGCNEAH